jgi:hypothetical protein
VVLAGTVSVGVMVQDDPFHRSARVNEWVFGVLCAQQLADSRRESGQRQDDRVQGQAHSGPHHRAVDADELQIAP